MGDFSCPGRLDLVYLLSAGPTIAKEFRLSKWGQLSACLLRPSRTACDFFDLTDRRNAWPSDKFERVHWHRLLPDQLPRRLAGGGRAVDRSRYVGLLNQLRASWKTCKVYLNHWRCCARQREALGEGSELSRSPQKKREHTIARLIRTPQECKQELVYPKKTYPAF